MPDWNNIRYKYEEDISKKLAGLPGHRDISEDKREFRSIISHELPETTSEQKFRDLIEILLSDKKFDINEVKTQWLNPELEKEQAFISKNEQRYNELKSSVTKWVKQNLTERQLQNDWKEHKTWLPRRYTKYDNPNLPFQEIAKDTLARYALYTELQM